jgi:hypothetical protein
MEPSGPTSGPPAPRPRLTGQAPPPLQVGQLLQATVLENSAGKLLLSVGHRQLSSETSLPFRPGEVLNLEVRSLGEQPVFKVLAALQASATGTTTAAVRTLLPRYGPTTPLLASLARLDQAPPGSLPPPLAAAVRAVLRELPDRASLSTAQGVKNAIERSGAFLEHRLASAGNTPAPVLDSDFKANLLRLLVQLRELPVADNRPPQAAPGRPATPADPGQPLQPALQRPVLQQPGVQQPIVQRPDLQPPQAPVTGRAPAGDATPPGQDSTRQPAPGETTPQAVKRALTAAGAVLPARASAAAPLGPTAAGTPVQAGGVSAGGGAPPPPPFPGVAPVPQSPVQVSLEPPDNLAHLRLDLLQQTEAALARVHLNQLASLPREGEHRLVEWLFDIPLRRGDSLDFWSARVSRDNDSGGETPETSGPLWSVQLAFDLPGLGPMQARINLQGEQVSTRFRAEHAETLPLLQAHLHELRQSLQAVGLEVGNIDCQSGSLAETGRSEPDPLIDEQA